MANSNVKVMHLLPSLEVGGMERLVCDLVSNRSQACTSVVCLYRLGALGEQLENDSKIKVLKLPGNVAKSLLTVTREIIRQKPDVIHCHNMQAHFFGALSASIVPFSVKIVLSKHGQVIPNRGMVDKLNLKLLKKSWVIGVSAEIVKIMQALPVKYAHPVEYIPNGLSLDKYNVTFDKASLRSELGLAADDVVLGIVSRLAKPKDHLLLLEAVRALIDEFANLKLVIVGDGPNRSKIEAFIQQHELQDRVIMLGERKDIPEILKCLDTFVLTSSSEGIPMTILEAMASSLPVIATRVGGIPSVVREGETGLLVDDKDVQGLASAIRKLLLSEDLRTRFGQEARQVVERKYSISATIASYEAVYGS